jgi:hypothetical protein
MVIAETADGAEHEVYLKPSGRPELGVEGLANEALAACVAGRIGLPICEPLVVEMSPDWIGSIADADVRLTLEQSSPIAFASMSAGTGWSIWAPSNTLTVERRRRALDIVAFDAFIENPDRRAGNPNLLVRGDEFRIIDHELAFRIRQLLFPRPEPWNPGYLDRLTQPDGHLFGGPLKGGKALDMGPIRAVWSGLSNEDLAACEEAIPQEWEAASVAVAAALMHLRAVRNRIDDCIAELERALK